MFESASVAGHTNANNSASLFFVNRYLLHDQAQGKLRIIFHVNKSITEETSESVKNTALHWRPQNMRAWLLTKQQQRVYRVCTTCLLWLCRCKRASALQISPVPWNASPAEERCIWAGKAVVARSPRSLRRSRPRSIAWLLDEGPTRSWPDEKKAQLSIQPTQPLPQGWRGSRARQSNRTRHAVPSGLYVRSSFTAWQVTLECCCDVLYFSGFHPFLYRDPL